MNPAQIMTRLSEIEDDLAQRQNDYERATGEQSRLKRDWNLRFARALVAQPKTLTVDERKAQALLALAASDDGIYEEYSAAEAQADALRSVMDVLKTRASIGQSLLKSLTREFSVRAA